MEENTPPKQPSNKAKTIMIIVLAVIVVAAGVYGAYFSYNKSRLSQKTAQESNESTEIAPTSTPSDNTNVEGGTNDSGNTVTTSVVINPKFKNISNFNDFSLSKPAEDLLLKNGFAVVPGYYQEFFQVYQSNRDAQTPSLITTDSILHTYHTMFDYLLRKLEEGKLIAQVKQLNSAMLSEAVTQYNTLKGTEWENAAKRNVGFFAVASKLMDSKVTVPAVVDKEVKQELALIAAHAEIAPSPVMNIGSGPDVIIGGLPLEALKEDYSQYIPRGHYDKTAALQSYFKSMMWYGRLTFRFKNDDEIKSAALITLALNHNNNSKTWSNIYEPINFFVGKSDDISYYQFKDLMEKTYGASADVRSVASDKDTFTALVAATRTLNPPQINSIPVFNSTIQPDRAKEINGFRFMGQRFTIDAAIFQRLIDRETPGRMLPMGLDIPAALGSKEALKILTDQGETKYQNYSDNMSKLQTYLAGLSTETWSQNLYWGWLNSLRPLLTENLPGYPAFMQNVAWVKKGLNTFLGSWTELKHDTILYAKQSYAERGGEGSYEKKDDRGYVEPNPELYGRLADLLSMTNKNLNVRGLLLSSVKVDLDKMESLSRSLKTISEKELNGGKITDADYELIRSYGEQLFNFWLGVNREEIDAKKSTINDFLDQNPAALVADVATDPNGWVLEEATGRISQIYAEVPIDGKLRLAKGGIYSYYEFTWPLSDRLTDSKWRALLDDNKAPKLPAWTADFTTKAAN